MRFWWCYRGGPGGPRYTIELTAAEDHAGACVTFHERQGSPCVHALTSPALLAACEGMAPGDLGIVSVERLPSVRDQFRDATGRLDREAMREAGFDD